MVVFFKTYWETVGGGFIPRYRHRWRQVESGMSKVKSRSKLALRPRATMLRNATHGTAAGHVCLQ